MTGRPTAPPPDPVDAREEREGLVESLFHGTGETYDEIAHLATWGRDRKWKEELLGLLDAPKRVLDLACGTGILTLEMARRFGCHVTGVELRAEYLDICRERAARFEFDVELIHANAEDVDLGDRVFDHITSCYIPKYVNLGKVVPRVVAALAPGGLIIFQDFAYPSIPWVQDVFDDHFERMRERCKDHPDWAEVWELLPDVLKKTTWIADTRDEMIAAGLVDVQVVEQSLGMSALVHGRKPL
jgi:demethylmenaquinone methyltransferase/2-methoxy-6-polyprenyl-1,4-benzoquinol methylase